MNHKGTRITKARTRIFFFVPFLPLWLGSCSWVAGIARLGITAWSTSHNQETGQGRSSCQEVMELDPPEKTGIRVREKAIAHRGKGEAGDEAEMVAVVRG